MILGHVQCNRLHLLLYVGCNYSPMPKCQRQFSWATVSVILSRPQQFESNSRNGYLRGSYVYIAILWNDYGKIYDDVNHYDRLYELNHMALWRLAWKHAIAETMARERVWFETMRPGQNGRQILADTFLFIILNENCCISISLRFVPKRSKLPLVQIKASCRTGEPMPI